MRQKSSWTLGQGVRGATAGDGSVQELTVRLSRDGGQTSALGGKAGAAGLMAGRCRGGGAEGEGRPE